MSLVALCTCASDAPPLHLFGLRGTLIIAPGDSAIGTSLFLKPQVAITVVPVRNFGLHVTNYSGYRIWWQLQWQLLLCPRLLVLCSVHWQTATNILLPKPCKHISSSTTPPLPSSSAVAQEAVWQAPRQHCHCICHYIHHTIAFAILYVLQSRKKRFGKLQEGAVAHQKFKKRKTELPRDKQPKKKPKH